MSDVATASASGDRLTALTALRDRLAADLDNAEKPYEVATLALRLTEVLAQIDSIPVSTKVSVADEIAKRRASRRGSRATGKARASRSG